MMIEPHEPIHVEHVDRAEGADRLSAILTAIASAQDKERISIAISSMPCGTGRLGR